MTQTIQTPHGALDARALAARLEAVEAERDKLAAERDTLAKACDEWAEVSQRNYQRARDGRQFADMMQARASALSAMLAVHVVTTLVIFGCLWGAAQ